MESMITGWRRYVLVQPPLMILLFAQSMSGNILTDLIVYRTCRVRLGINNTQCDILHNNSSSNEALKIDTEVQPEANLIALSQACITSILPAFSSLFMGPWSDKYGRKPLLLAGYTGTSLTFLFLAIMASWDVQPWFFLIAFIPSAIFGGFCILLLASMCYIADITNAHDRAWQLAWLQALISLGILMGTLAGPLVFYQYGYACVFAVAAVMCTLAGLHVLIYVPETIERRAVRTWSSLFDISLVKDLVSTCVKKREGFNRCIVWCCIMCITLAVVILEGDFNIGYLFASARLGWDVKKYSVYSAINVIVGILGTILAVKVIVKCIGCSETTMAVVAIVSSLLAAVVRAFTWKPWHMYLAVGIGMFSGIFTPMIRAILSKSVPPKDTGKVFSLTTTVETLTPFGASALYGILYSCYMPPVYPSPVWLMSVLLLIINIFLIVYMRIQISKHNNIQYISVSEDNE